MLVLHFTAIIITFCVSITFCGDYYILRRNNGNRTDWSTIQEVFGRVISNKLSPWREADLELRARLSLNSTTRSPIKLIVSITIREKLPMSTVEERQLKSKENISE